jgi:hypothetical protein
MIKARTAKLASYERRYRELAQRLAQIGYIATGSVAQRYNRCGKSYCACHGDPPRLHGPYWHFTAKVEGKTVNKRLSEREAQLYQEWIANDRAARALLVEMREVAAQAQELLLAQEASAGSGPGSRGASPQRRTTRVPRPG